MAMMVFSNDVATDVNDNSNFDNAIDFNKTTSIPIVKYHHNIEDGMTIRNAYECIMLKKSIV